MNKLNKTKEKSLIYHIYLLSTGCDLITKTAQDVM